MESGSDAIASRVACDAPAKPTAKSSVPAAFTVAAAAALWSWDFSHPLPWTLIGGCGALLWSIRFPVQWWMAERRSYVTLPPPFFWISFVGSCLLRRQCYPPHLVY